MKLIQSLVIIGSGNVATHMARAFHKAGLNLRGIYSQTNKNAQTLARELDVAVFNSIGDIPADSDAYLLAVSDAALPELLKELPAYDGILMHTSGSVGLDVFPDKFKNTSVFYPLQTFSKQKNINFSEVPILIESHDKKALLALQELGGKISGTVKPMDSMQRKQLHLAAVFACNFSNFMYYIAQDLLKEKDLDFDLLKPLINETVQKLNTLSPKEAQTGPAIRKDINTLNLHIESLKQHPEYQHIYHLISAQIQKLKS